MIIDAKNLVLGRLATIAAKKALLGEKVEIVNSEMAVLTGRKKEILNKHKARREKGTPFKGPFYPRTPDRFVKRVIRGMLPYKQEKGMKAFKRIMCHVGVPEKFKDKKLETLGHANVKKMQNLKYIPLKQLCRELGAKI